MTSSTVFPFSSNNFATPSNFPSFAVAVPEIFPLVLYNFISPSGSKFFIFDWDIRALSTNIYNVEAE